VSDYGLVHPDVVVITEI
jgi:hypothetical protein